VIIVSAIAERARLVGINHVAVDTPAGPAAAHSSSKSWADEDSKPFPGPVVGRKRPYRSRP
jgi:hypothetical protein